MSFTIHQIHPVADQDAFDGLLECFRLCGRFATPETIRVFTCCPARELEKSGWIVPAQYGRWSKGYAPGGDLLTAIESEKAGKREDVRANDPATRSPALPISRFPDQTPETI